MSKPGSVPRPVKAEPSKKGESQTASYIVIDEAAEFTQEDWEHLEDLMAAARRHMDGHDE